MMLVSGVMMFIAALQGKGNDTVAMPLGITVAGAFFTSWSFYKIGYIKSDLDKITDETEHSMQRTALFLQSLETTLYIIVLGVGMFLLLNQGFMNRVLNLMAGGFTTLNGVLGLVNTFRRRQNRDFRWWFKLVLTLIELGIGPYFLIFSDSVEGGWFIAMGALTTVAGTLEVISAITPESLKNTVQDGKDIVRILKN